MKVRLQAAPLSIPALALLLLALAGVAVADDKKVSDDVLYDRVTRALITDRQLGSRPLEVKVSDGEVSVSGFVETEKLKKRVEKVVKKVNGVTNVENNVVVRPF